MSPPIARLSVGCQHAFKQNDRSSLARLSFCFEKAIPRRRPHSRENDTAAKNYFEFPSTTVAVTKEVARGNLQSK